MTDFMDGLHGPFRCGHHDNPLTFVDPINRWRCQHCFPEFFPKGHDMTTKPKYPEHERLKAIPQDDRDRVGEAAETLLSTGFEIYHQGSQLMDPEDVVARAFGIDLRKITREKDQMLAEIRHQNDARDLAAMLDELKGD